MHGVIAAVPTPVDASGAPIESLFAEHCQWCLKNGCDGLNILGSTGEANSFDTETRKTVMGWAIAACRADQLMVGTGTPSLVETIELTKHADDLGYRVALVLPPYYYKPVSEDGLYRWYSALHQALGARKIEIYFYNFPQMTGIVIPVSVIERLRSDFPKRFSGIKDSSGDLEYCRALVGKLPGFRVFPSSETTLCDAARDGYAGCISATVNQTARLCADVWAKRDAPDEDSVKLIASQRQTIAGTSLIPAVKYLVGQRTGQNGWDAVLPPFVGLTPDQKSELISLKKRAYA